MYRTYPLAVYFCCYEYRFSIYIYIQCKYDEYEQVVFVDYAFLLCFLYICPLQIFYAINPTYASDDDRRSKSNDQLEEILATGRGKQIFELFLATDLSVENILFYNAVAQWKAEFREGSDVTRTQAKRISRKYLNSRSYLEINCSDRARQAVMEVLDDDNAVIEVTLFDKVQHEIARLMVSN